MGTWSTAGGARCSESPPACAGAQACPRYGTSTRSCGSIASRFGTLRKTPATAPPDAPPSTPSSIPPNFPAPCCSYNNEWEAYFLLTDSIHPSNIIFFSHQKKIPPNANRTRDLLSIVLFFPLQSAALPSELLVGRGSFFIFLFYLPLSTLIGYG